MLEVRPKTKSRREHNSRGRFLIYLLCLISLGLLAAGGLAFRRARQANASTSGIPEEIRVSQEMVRQSIREDLRSSFSPVEETVLEKLPEDKTRVSGWVDVTTPAGIGDRQNYSIILFRNAAGDWVGEKLSVIPQM